MKRIVAILPLLLVSRCAHAGTGFVECRNPFVHSAADVNVVVMPFTHQVKGVQPDSIGNELGYLVQLELLFSILKYGSVAAVHLVADVAHPDECTPDIVLRKLGYSLQPGKGLIMVWGLIYEEAGNIYVRTYVRFLRRDRTESLPLTIKDTSFAMAPSAQSFASAPTQLSASDLRAIEAEFHRAILVHTARTEYSSATPLVRLPAEHKSVGYVIHDTAGDWMLIQPDNPGMPAGWVHARAQLADLTLTKRLPELRLIEGIAGYIRYRVALDRGENLSGLVPDIEQALESYRTDDASGAMASAIGKQLSGLLRLNARIPEESRTASSLFSAARKQVPYSAEANNLDLVLQVQGYYEKRSGTLAAKSVATGFVQAIALDPSNKQTVSNVQSFLRLINAAPPATSPNERVDPKEASRLLQQFNGASKN